MVALQIDTYEGNDALPVITHVFYGATRGEVFDIVEAHKGTDEFFRAACTTGEWNGIELRNRQAWRKV